MEEEGVDTLIAVGNAFETPDIFWLTGFRSPDMIFYIKNRGSDATVASYFHTLGRVKKESFIKDTYDFTDLFLSLRKEGKRLLQHPELLMKELLGNLFSGKVIGVPDYFPASILVAVQSLGYEVKVVPNLIKNARATKSSREIKMIQRAGTATISAISKVFDIIKESDIGPNKVLQYKKEPLTVNHIKLTLEHSLLDEGAESAEDAIVAVGKKGFDWHYLGKPADKLKAGVPIILDVFPRLKREMYVADVTRTVVKGTLSPKVRSMFEAVQEAKDAVIDTLKHGVKIDDVNLACYETLQDNGFDSSRLNPEAVEGMTHGLGHGIGLEVHENPSLYSRDALFEEGNVVAIEPGVYLKAVGGVRLEDDYVVRKGKPKRLTPGIDDMWSL